MLPVTCPSAGSPPVQDAAQQHLVHIYGKQALHPGFQYLAMHMRLGGMETETSLGETWKTSGGKQNVTVAITKGGPNGALTDLIEGILCIQKLGAS